MCPEVLSMKLAYCVWLLSRDERVLKVLWLVCIGLATLCYMHAGVLASRPRDRDATREHIQLSADSRLVLP
jgi:hypothetical protein